MFKFGPEITQEHKDHFQRELKKLKNLPCVKDNRLLDGGTSVTDPISRSQGYHYCIVSYHQNLKALEEYQSSNSHHEYVTHTKHDGTAIFIQSFRHADLNFEKYPASLCGRLSKAFTDSTLQYRLRMNVGR
ncbi:uncharacterized protein A1O9_05211 [Exophiala aquamarina CBS 119918]|uniref:Stress-response A/B barrel domain-containing protein n=1 Tax=Exophiala aquamarina CBS 119918 TaxID=1182545 RepID=A0A072PB47_9EURO|nr:uncharacterized protein A1O9_05211 [Exophiala aquamarina CBS 119918]KEF57294.1 hypothetical protein A1O9_05211 [Exophiala aquamarina CBS 119918]